MWQKYGTDKSTLKSKKVTSMVGPNVKLWSNVILVLPTVMIELSIVRKKIGYHWMWQKYCQK